MKTETKGELREKLKILETNLKRCWICGEEKITMHHTKPGNNNSKIPLCRSHHSFIEGLKRLIFLTKHKNKISFYEFKIFLKNKKILEELE